MKKITIIILISINLGVVFTSCQNTAASRGNEGDASEKVSNEHLTMAVLFQQKAAEYNALCYQAFNMAKMRIDNSSKMLGGFKKKAIVVDIDETMLDNSPYEAKMILDSISYPTEWDTWMNSASAKAVPGALEFAKWVETQKIEIYYISNRKEKYRAPTLKNLQELGFPYADNEHLMLKTDESSKKSRREKVQEKANIILLIGDNLNDFTEAFERKTTQERFEITDSLKSKFGTSFIVLPDAMYGDWENALYNYDHSLTPHEKIKIRHQKLIGF